MLWKQKSGNRATYEKLVAIFGRAGRQDYADIVTKIVGNA